MRIINSVSLLGNLGKDPIIRESKNGNKWASVSLAVNQNFKDNEGNWKKITQWHDIVAWGRVAETFESNLKKGSEIFIHGKLNTRTYETKEGEKKYITEVVVDDVLKIDRPKKSE